MAKLMVEIDGQAVPLAECDWVFYKACGCPRGVMRALIGDAVLYDEEAAWREFFGPGTKREIQSLINRARRDGVSAELMTHARYCEEISPLMALRKDPHTLEGAAEGVS